ncbi:hypothetical protein COT75_00570 [Candidatus Beckwithbacteria bacterium CG10_big_fil_rev_8_21_14_0_10_34_10]|uniref:SHS2 domain-containing protein n=1 Tax=Candidatus Beckwithbacteria bacterium CG10_big_fil_rev_8_21_14_0_10_34_10 TaxID=1974495 RepID=A0A2H0WAH8_9BACT|nr:MAG: hypothetical protein COT75_00570 [Candidatus Beckwithbacteria bacterium CG10_big_fil_rev_8_21_14_0_10_34_10]
MPVHFGLDIGSDTIKAVQSEKRGAQNKLIALGEIKTPVSLNSQSEVDKRALASAIKKLLKDTGINVKKVNLSLSESMIYSQVINLPYLSETELASAISFEAEQYIPVPLDEVKLEYIVLSESIQGAQGKRMEVLLVAAQKHAIDKIAEVAELAEITPVALETEILSLTRSINSLFEANSIVLDLGHMSTNIFILVNQKLKLTRSLNTAGEALTRAVAQELNMEVLQAEQYKINYGLLPTVLEGKVAKTIIPIFGVILSEIKKGLNFFLQREKGVEINTLILSGGGALMPGLDQYLARSLGLEIVTFNPFKGYIEDGALKKITHHPKFATAVGLSLREAEE